MSICCICKTQLNDRAEYVSILLGKKNKEKNVNVCSQCGEKISLIYGPVQGETFGEAFTPSTVELKMAEKRAITIDSERKDIHIASNESKQKNFGLHPMEIMKKLDEFVIGQEAAKKILAVAAYNHQKRILASKENLNIDKSNVLLIGPSGTGKTFLVKTLSKILNVPIAIGDATGFTEAGYIGKDVESLLVSLYYQSGCDLQRAEQGIVFLDEVDKLSCRLNKDVGTEGVQQALLKMFEDANVDITVGDGTEKKIVTVNTKNILFICGGAFPALEEIIEERLGEVQEKPFTNVTTEDIIQFGFIPEFMGRIPVIATLDPLDERMIRDIITKPKNSILSQYIELFRMDGVNLSFTEDSFDAIAAFVLGSERGARGIRTIFEELLTDYMLTTPGTDIHEILITKDYVEKTLNGG